jgi:putative DNA primase/helicase
MTLSPSIDWHGLYNRGWSIFPVKPGSKQPAMQWERFQKQRATPEEVAAWAATDWNVGIVTGAISGLIVLDCDTPEAIDQAEALGVAGALTLRTAKGRHFYFRHPGGIVHNRVKFYPGMDLRGDGGFVVGPGSIHPDGTVYSDLEFWL